MSAWGASWGESFGGSFGAIAGGGGDPIDADIYAPARTREPQRRPVYIRDPLHATVAAAMGIGFALAAEVRFVPAGRLRESRRPSHAYRAEIGLTVGLVLAAEVSFDGRTARLQLIDEADLLEGVYD